MSWGTAPLIFEDEDEAALKSRFVELCAKYPDRDPREIGRYIFSGLRDPGFRGEDAGLKWSIDLEIRERIAAAIRNGGTEVQIALPTKEELAAEILALARDTKIDAKDRNAAYRNAAEVMGLITKIVDKTIDNKADRPPPTINFHLGVKPDELTE